MKKYTMLAFFYLILGIEFVYVEETNEKLLTPPSNNIEKEETCVIGHKSWATENLRVCDRDFYIESCLGIQGKQYHIGRIHTWSCDIKNQTCDEPEKYKKVDQGDIVLLTEYGVSTAKWDREGIYPFEDTEYGEFNDEKTGETISYPFSNGKEVTAYYNLDESIATKYGEDKFHFALHSRGSLRPEEKYSVSDFFSFDDAEVKPITIGEALSIAEFKELVKNYELSLNVTLKEKNGFKIITVSEKDKGEKTGSVGLMIDPSGALVYKWKTESPLYCEGMITPYYAMKINGHTIISGTECVTYRPTQPFLLIKINSSYKKLNRYVNVRMEC